MTLTAVSENKKRRFCGKTGLKIYLHFCTVAFDEFRMRQINIKQHRVNMSFNISASNVMLHAM